MDGKKKPAIQRRRGEFLERAQVEAGDMMESWDPCQTVATQGQGVEAGQGVEELEE